jgi:hypothetical protein
VVYGAVVFLTEDVGTAAMVANMGLFVIRTTGDESSIINDETFVPKLMKGRFSDEGDCIWLCSYRLLSKSESLNYNTQKRDELQNPDVTISILFP